MEPIVQTTIKADKCKTPTEIMCGKAAMGILRGWVHVAQVNELRQAFLDVRGNASQTREGRAAGCASATCGGPSTSLRCADQVREGSVWVLCWNPCLCPGEAARDS